MRKPQRTWHRRIWLALGPLTFIGLVAAIASTPATERNVSVTPGREPVDLSTIGSSLTTQPEARP